MESTFWPRIWNECGKDKTRQRGVRDLGKTLAGNLE